MLLVCNNFVLFVGNDEHSKKLKMKINCFSLVCKLPSFNWGGSENHFGPWPTCLTKLIMVNIMFLIHFDTGFNLFNIKL